MKSSKPRYALFGKALRRRALKSGLAGDTALARATGIGRSTVKQWWGGISLPEPHRLIALAAALDFDIGELVDLHEEAFMASLGATDRRRIRAMIDRRTNPAEPRQDEIADLRTLRRQLDDCALTAAVLMVKLS